MNTITEMNSKSGLKSRPEPLITEMQMQFDFTPRVDNRVIAATGLLTLIHLEAPAYLAHAKLFGSWAWMQFRKETPNVTRIFIKLNSLWKTAASASKSASKNLLNVSRR
jgi:hypothetical protein